MEFSVNQIAAMLGGEVKGDGDEKNKNARQDSRC